MADWSIACITLMNMYSFVGIQTPVEKKNRFVGVIEGGGIEFNFGAKLHFLTR